MNKNTQIQQDCDRLWQEIMMIIWMGRCQKCLEEGLDIDNAEDLAGHHIISKGRAPIRIRHSVDNGILLCWKHHQKAEKIPNAFHTWLFIHHPHLWDHWNIHNGSESNGTILTTEYQEIYDELIVRRADLDTLKFKVFHKDDASVIVDGKINSFREGEMLSKVVEDSNSSNDIGMAAILDGGGRVVWRKYYNETEK